MKTMRTWFRNRREGGQTLVLFTFFLVVLVLFIGLGIDLGFAYITRANLSKACDAAVLAGIDNYWRTEAVARGIATNAFFVNYGRSGRDATPPSPEVNFVTDPANGNTTLTVTASASIKTFFIRILPQWKTLMVANTSQSLRAHVIMSVVLDRSGSMREVCATDSRSRMDYLKDAVTNFVNYFSAGVDRVALVSFSTCSRVDLPMQLLNKGSFTAAATALNPEDWTASASGMADGFRQISNFTPASGEVVQRVIVFFTDGYANTFSNNFNCGIRNIAPGGAKFNPASNCGTASSGCSATVQIPSVDQAYTGFASIGPSYPERPPANNPYSPNMRAEAEARALMYATRARTATPQKIFIYSVGLGCDPAGINTNFLAYVANVDGKVDQEQPIGLSLVAPTGEALHDAFQQIAKTILLRLTR